MYYMPSTKYFQDLPSTTFALQQSTSLSTPHLTLLISVHTSHRTLHTPHFTLLSWLPRNPTPATFCSNSYRQGKTHLNAAKTQRAANRAPPPDLLPRTQDPFNTHSGKRKKIKATRKNKHFPDGILWPFQATLLICIYIYIFIFIYMITLFRTMWLSQLTSYIHESGQYVFGSVPIGLIIRSHQQLK